MKGWGFEMNLKDQMNGVQHVGVPTNDIETTIKFYEALGFKIAFQTVNEAAKKYWSNRACNKKRPTSLKIQVRAQAGG